MVHTIISQIQRIWPKDLNKSGSVSTFQNQEVEKSRFPESFWLENGLEQQELFDICEVYTHEYSL